MIKNMFKKTAVLMAGVVLMVAIAQPVFCAGDFINDAKAQASLSSDEISILEARAYQNADLMEIESGGDDFFFTFCAIIGGLALLAALLAEGSSDS